MWYFKDLIIRATAINVGISSKTTLKWENSGLPVSGIVHQSLAGVLNSWVFTFRRGEGVVLLLHFTICYITLYSCRQTSVLGIAGKREVKGGMWFGTHPRLTPNRAPVKRGCVFFPLPEQAVLWWRGGLLHHWRWFGNTGTLTWIFEGRLIQHQRWITTTVEYIQFERKPDWWKDFRGKTTERQTRGFFTLSLKKPCWRKISVNSLSRVLKSFNITVCFIPEVGSF